MTALRRQIPVLVVVGVIVAGIAARGGLEILEDARKAQAEAAD